MTSRDYNQDSLIFGVDIGGTSLRAAVSRSPESIIAKTRRPSPAHQPPEAMVQAVHDMYHELLSQVGANSAIAVGVSSPGPVDTVAGALVDPPNLPLYDTVPLRDMLRGALALLLIFVGLSTVLDVEPILAAFLAGGVFALLFHPPEGLRHQLSGISWGFLIPIFFINVGLRFEVAALLNPEALARAGVIIAVAFFVKFLPALLFVFWGFSLRAAAATGFLLSARLSLVIAVATVGLELGLLNQEDRAIAVMIAAVTSMICPVLFRQVITHGSAKQPGDVAPAEQSGTR